MTDFIQESKQLHFNGEQKEYWAGAFNESSNDTKRHFQLLADGFKLLHGLSVTSSLSIGDNRCRDAYFAKKAFGCHSTASDLCLDNMHKAAEHGFVDAVTNIDVESIPLADSSVDIVITKESFHHWPRPYLGLYEMIRVARKAILLIEPNDVLTGPPSPYIREGQYSNDWEKVGNFKFALSMREILKTAWALRLPAVAFHGLNDPSTAKHPDHAAWLEQKEHLDSLGDSGKRQYNLIATAIYLDSDVLAEVEPGISDDSISLHKIPSDPFATISRC